MPITPTPAFSGTLYSRAPFSYTFSSDVSYAVNPSYQFTDSSPAILAATNDASASFSSTTGYVGTGSLGNLIVDYISSNAITSSNVTPATTYSRLTEGGMTKDSQGNVFLTDFNSIKKVTPAGVVSTFAGSPLIYGYSDGPGPVATFAEPSGLACDGDDNLYVADLQNSLVRKITPGGIVSTFAGTRATLEYQPGPFGYNSIAYPYGVAVDSNSNVYCTSYLGAVLAKITPDGVLSFVAGFGSVDGTADGTGDVYENYQNVFITGITGGAAPTIGGPPPPISRRLAYSLDGQTWTILGQNPLVSYIRKVARNSANVWVAVGSNSAAVGGWEASFGSSGDGSNWSRARSGQPYFSSGGFDVAYGNAGWIAVGQDGTNTMITSADGKSWTGMGKPVFSTAGYGITWSGSLWVAVGQGTNTIGYSSNGTSWTGGGTGTLFDTYGRSVTYANNRYIALGGSNVPAITSTTGSNWSSMTGLTDISTGRTVAYGSGTWVLLGNTNSGVGRGFISTDGTSWTRNTSLDFTGFAFSVMYNEGTGIWVVMGTNSGGTQSIRYTSVPAGGWNSNTTVQEESYAAFEVYTDTQFDSQGTVAPVIPIRTALSTARFSIPRGLTIDGNGDIYVVDQGGRRIRKYSPDANLLTTYAGTGIPGYVDGAYTSARFSNGRHIAWSSTDGKFYVTDTDNSKLRILDSNTNTVSTYGIPTLTEKPYAIAVSGINQYYTTTSNLNIALPPRLEVRPSGTRPSGYIIADSLTIPVTVSNRIDVSSTAIGGVFNLYKYEPFGANVYTINSGASTTDTLSYTNSSAELFAFLSNVSGNQISFGSTNGPSVSYTNPLSLVIEDLSGTTVMESISNTVYMNPGRFFPPAANTAYVFYKNEPITPQTFSATISLQTPTAAPALPAGLGFSRIASNSFQLTGTPTVQVPSSNYKVIGRGLSNTSQIVTVDVNIRVASERLLMDVSGSSNVFSMAVDTPISNRVVTSRCPPYPNAGSNVAYTWFPPLPNGLSFRTLGGIPVSSGYVAVDPSSTVVLTGTPTEAAAQAFPTGAYNVTLTATRITSPFISNTIPFSFSFGESVVFGSSNLTTLYARAAVQSSVSSNSFTAQTRFAVSPSLITTIFSPDLRSDLSLNFVFAQQRAYLTGTPLTTGTGTYTLVASNANGFSASNTISYTISNDQVFFDYSITPAIDTCYTLVKNRPVSNALTGYYPYPIDFSAYTLSGCNVGFKPTGLPTGVTLSNVTTNRVRLIGTPTVSSGLTTLTIDVSCTPTQASNSTTVKYSVINDVYTFNDPSFNFIENVAFTPIQISATSLAGFPVIQYSSSNLPAGLSLSAAGLMTGPIQASIDGSFSVDVTTGYSSAYKVYNYTVVPDSILLTTPQSSYVLPAGSSANIPVTGLAYSGGTVSNYQFSNLPNTYGLSIGSTSGLIGGTIDPSPPTNVAFAVQGSVGNSTGKLDASWNTPIVTFGRSAGGPIITSPGVRSVLAYQYAPITTVTFAGSGTGRVYFFMDTTQLPRGLGWNPISQTISGTPVEVGVFDIAVYARDSIGTTVFAVTFDVQIPRLIRTQIGAGAYTSLVRQYTEVNAAQNSRDSRVFPSQERALGEFMAPDAPSVITPSNCIM